MDVGVKKEIKRWSYGVEHGGTPKKEAQNVDDNWRRGLGFRGPLL